MIKWSLPNINPFKVQMAAREWSAGRRRAMLHMEMGLGKTFTALDEYVDLLGRKKVDAMVVLAPDSLKETWAESIRKAGVDHLGQVVISPAVPAAFRSFWMVNYEAIRFDSVWVPLRDMVEQGGVFLVADESTRIKNFQAQTTKRALVLGKKAEYTRALTGLAMVRDVMDWFPQLQFCGALQGMNPYAFRARYAKMGGYMGRQVVGIRDDTREELQGIIDGASFRALKKDWLDLPAKNYAERHIKMTPPQEKLYKQMADEMIILLEAGVTVEANMVISQLIKLQQIASGFIMDNTGHPRLLVDPDINPRMAEVEDILEGVSGKVLIFATYLESIRLLHKRLSKRWRGGTLVGGDAAASAEAVRKFNSDPSHKYLLAQTDTGGIGHTMLGTREARCATTIFFENNFRFGARAQAEDRNHRIGQDAPCVTYVDFISSPVDRHVIRSLQTKKDLITSLVDNRDALHS